MEIDKIAIEDVRKANLSLCGSAKLNPSIGKEIVLQTFQDVNSFQDSVTGLGSNLSNHANGT